MEQFPSTPVNRAISSCLFSATPSTYTLVGTPLTLTTTATNARRVYELAPTEKLILMPGQVLGITGVTIQKL